MSTPPQATSSVNNNTEDFMDISPVSNQNSQSRNNNNNNTSSSSATTSQQRQQQQQQVPVYCCPVCLREYDEDILIPYQLRCQCAICARCLDEKKKEKNPVCAEGHPVTFSTSTSENTTNDNDNNNNNDNGNEAAAAAISQPPKKVVDAVPSKILLQLVHERREYCPLHPNKKIEIWCPACASGLCVTCHMGDDHMKRCASIQQYEITTPQAAEAVQRRAAEMLSNFAEAESRVAHASLPPLEAYSAEALMNKMRDLAVQARQAFDEKLFEIVSANLELALGHQIGAAYHSMEDRHQRLVLLQHATRQIQDAEALAKEQPAAAAARLRRFQIDPEIGKPLTTLPPLRMLDGLKLEVEPIWKDIVKETINVLETETISTLAITEAENHRVKIIKSDGSFIRHLGTAGRPGRGELEFAGVRGVALLGDGQTMAICEMENHRVKLVKIDGSFIGNLGSEDARPGTGVDEFNGPRGVAVLGDGVTLAVCDFGNHRVKIIGADGTFIRHIGGHPNCQAGDGPNEFNKPISVAVFGDGLTLAVTDLENHRVKIVHSDGTFLRHIGEPMRPDRKIRGLNELEFNLPLGICVLGDGVTLAVCDSENHRVKIIRGDDGSFVRHIGSGVPGMRAGDFNGPCGICTLSDGATMAITDFENHRVKIIRSDGAFIRHLGGRMSNSQTESLHQLQNQNTGGLPSQFQRASPVKKHGKGEQDFYGPWGVMCLDFHSGSPIRSGQNRKNLQNEADVSRTPSQINF